MRKFKAGDVVRVVEDLGFYYYNGELDSDEIPNYTVIPDTPFTKLHVDRNEYLVTDTWLNYHGYAEDFALVRESDVASPEPITMEVLHEIAKADRNYKSAKATHDSNVEFCDTLLAASSSELELAEEKLNQLKTQYNIA